MEWEAGYEAGIFNERGFVHNKSDPYRIPRHPIKNWDLNDFQDKIDSYFLIKDIIDMFREKYRRIRH